MILEPIDIFVLIFLGYMCGIATPYTIKEIKELFKIE